MRAGQVPIARRALVDAHDACARIADAALRDRAETQIDIEDATLLRATDPRRSIDTLTGSIDFLAAHDIGALLPYGYLQRARSQRKAGDDMSALADYRTALLEVEKQKGGIREAEVRLSFLDTARQIIDELIELELSRGAVESAFRVSEARHHLQSDAMGEIPRLPAGTAAIEYVVLPHATVIFCLHRGGITARRVDIERCDLDARIDALATSIKRRAPVGDVQAASSALYTLLIEPVRAPVAGNARLMIVPDRRLFAVPFAALYDARNRRYLVEDIEIRFVPAIAGLSFDARSALEPALVVADPPASRPRLSRGLEEAEQIASVHHGTLLRGTAATRASFVDAAQRSALIYFAGHARSDAAESNAALLLAGGAVLSESDIVQMRLAQRPLVVLAACGTFRGDPMHVAGMSSLSRAFLLAGARAVVGTLWEVDDDDAAAMFLRFHENLRADGSPARALRDAQLAMLQSSDPRLMHPATWSPVELLTIGG
jgi:CHAT domain-containing protein